LTKNIPENLNIFDKFNRYGVLEYIRHFKNYVHRGCTREEIYLKLNPLLSGRAIDKQIQRLIKGKYISRRVLKVPSGDLVLFEEK